MDVGNGGETCHSAGGAVGYMGMSLVTAIILKFITQQVMFRAGGDASGGQTSQP